MKFAHICRLACLLAACCLPLMVLAKPPGAAPPKAAGKPAAKGMPAKAMPAKAMPAKVWPAKVRPAAPDSGLNKSVVRSEQIFRSLPGFRPLSLDLYQPLLPAPKGKNFPRPALVFVHGGGWTGGDARHAAGFENFPDQLARLAARGFVVASVTYRLSGEARFPAALQDVKSAIGWLRQHAADFNIDTTRIAVWGEGEGGYLAAMTGVTCGVGLMEPVSGDTVTGDAPSNCVQAVIDWGGISDFETLFADLGKPAPDKSAQGDWLGCEPSLCAPGLAKSASPIAHVTAMNPPFLIQHGGADTVVSPNQAQKLYDTLRGAGIPAELALYPDAGHSFDAATSRQALAKLESFLDTLFPKVPVAGAKPPRKSQPLPY